MSQGKKKRVKALQARVDELVRHGSSDDQTAELAKTRESHAVDSVWIRVLEEEVQTANAEIGELLKRLKYLGESDVFSSAGSKVTKKDNLTKLYLEETAEAMADWERENAMLGASP